MERRRKRVEEWRQKKLAEQQALEASLKAAEENGAAKLWTLEDDADDEEEHGQLEDGEDDEQAGPQVGGANAGILQQVQTGTVNGFGKGQNMANRSLADSSLPCCR